MKLSDLEEAMEIKKIIEELRSSLIVDLNFVSGSSVPSVSIKYKYTNAGIEHAIKLAEADLKKLGVKITGKPRKKRSIKSAEEWVASPSEAELRSIGVNVNNTDGQPEWIGENNNVN